MKPRSNRHRYATIRIFAGMVLLSGIVLDAEPAYGQYRKWSVTASAGLNRLNLDAVDRKNASDVAGWLNQYNIAVPNFVSVKTSPFYSAGVRYRSDREFAISFSGLYWNKSVSSAYDGPDAILVPLVIILEFDE